MIHFYKGKTLSVCADAMIKEAAKNDKNRKSIIIVPDRFTLCTELAFMSLTGGSINGEVTSFSRLAQRVLEDKIKKCLSPEGAVMLMTRAIQGCKENLKCYGNIAYSTGFADEIFAGISAIRASKVSYSELRQCAEKMNKGYAKNKTEDIALIYQSYLDLLERNYTDSTSRLQAFCDAIDENCILTDCDIYITDFYAYTGIQYAIIEKMMRYCANVSVSIMDVLPDQPNSRIFPQLVTKKLRALQHVSCKEWEDVPCNVTLSASGDLISKYIYGYERLNPSDRTTGVANNIMLFSADTIEEEMSLVATEINDQVFNKGLRYREIAVVMADPNSYRPIMCRVFDRYHIPYFTDSRTLLSGESLAFSLLSWMRMLLANFSIESVCEFLKTSFSGVSYENVEIFENYCLKYSVSHTFNKPFELELEGEEAYRQKVAEDVRKILNKHRLDSLNLSEKHNAKYYQDLIKAYLKKTNYQKSLEELFKSQEERGEKESASRTAQSPAKFNGVLDNATNLLGDTEMTFEEYYQIIKTGMDSVKLAVIPQNNDSVYVGEGEDSRYDNIKVLFVVGATDKNFPKSTADEGILTDRDYDNWAKHSVNVGPTNKEQHDNGRFYSEQLLLCPTDKLILSYTGGEKIVESTVIMQLKEMFGLEIKKASNLLAHSKGKGGIYDLSTLISTAENGMQRVLSGLSSYRNGGEFDEELILTYGSLPEEYKAKIDFVLKKEKDGLSNPKDLFFGKDETSVSQLESYFACPFAHFIKYGLRAKEREVGKLEVKDTGTFIHAVLEKFYKDTTDSSASPKLKELTDDEIKTKVKEIIEQELNTPEFKSLMEGGKTGRVNILCNETEKIVTDLAKLTKFSKFDPSEFEAEFGKKTEQNTNKYDGLVLNDGTVLKGKIDRIDRFDGGYIAIIDYKSGYCDGNLKDVYMGKKIQLYVYLKALNNAGNKTAGVFYLPVKAKYIDDDKNSERYCYKGQVLNNDSIIEAFDVGYTEDKTHHIIPVKKSKDKSKNNKKKEQGNNESAYYGKNVLIEKSEFDNITDYVLRLTEQAVGEIKDGNYLPSPKKDACKYCMAKSICGYDCISKGTRGLDGEIKTESFDLSASCPNEDTNETTKDDKDSRGDK